MSTSTPSVFINVNGGNNKFNISDYYRDKSENSAWTKQHRKNLTYCGTAFIFGLIVGVSFDAISKQSIEDLIQISSKAVDLFILYKQLLR